jgi:hypothetical protein
MDVIQIYIPRPRTAVHYRFSREKARFAITFTKLHLLICYWVRMAIVILQHIRHSIVT